MFTSTTRPPAKSPAQPDGAGTLSCVWSHGSGCDAHVPSGVVLDAWRAETEATHRDDGFFHFAWDDGLWLGYGMPDGTVRGVYCAAHRTERAGHVDVSRPRPRLTLVTSSGDVTIA